MADALAAIIAITDEKRVADILMPYMRAAAYPECSTDNIGPCCIGHTDDCECYQHARSAARTIVEIAKQDFKVMLYSEAIKRGLPS